MKGKILWYVNLKKIPEPVMSMSIMIKYFLTWFLRNYKKLPSGIYSTKIHKDGLHVEIKFEITGDKSGN